MMPRHRRIGAVIAVVLAAVLALASPVAAYLQFTVQQSDGRQINLRWQRLPIRYFVTDRGVSGVTATQVQAAIDRAFSTWQGLPSASVSFQFVGFTGADPDDSDGMSTLGFLSRPNLDRVLASTSFLFDRFTGEIVEADVFFNAAQPWGVSASGEVGRFDVQSVALHEIGHLFGLGHSALGETEVRPTGGRRVIAAEAVMFPIAFAAGNIAERTPRADDVAGLSDLYPSGSFSRENGSLTGRVTKNGRGVFGAHVVAFHLQTGRLIAGFSFTDQGDFTIDGLSPGPHILRVEPLDDADIESFFDQVSRVDLNFRVAFYEGYVIVPRGGMAEAVEVPVVPK